MGLRSRGRRAALGYLEMLATLLGQTSESTHTESLCKVAFGLRGLEEQTFILLRVKLQGDLTLQVV